MGERVNPMVTVVMFIAAVFIFVVGIAVGVSTQDTDDVQAERLAVHADLLNAEQMVCTEPPRKVETGDPQERCAGAVMMRRYVWGQLTDRRLGELS
ncbi:hypothetical protein KABACHOK_00370 [Brevundimonas phage vB_BpoS-Kabachok]|uniref:Uncharacterized protein n=2 Tax=Marchewkavirus TaxID=3425052 RepID=A0A9E7MPB8_9CAUD|nr:hypothetical protein KABACHOK_00370 [Brevundimonas phage vB_BpoS-Kabachok]USN14569.1 hypothetical protein DOMOVOI_00940 [Brevundimonas phage vB_BpoS-Domovoi]